VIDNVAMTKKTDAWLKRKEVYSVTKEVILRYIHPYIHNILSLSL
jgi:hypothetical protein